MYDAFRATKGPDGELIDTEEWSAETEARVEVRRPTSVRSPPVSARIRTIAARAIHASPRESSAPDTERGR